MIIGLIDDLLGIKLKSNMGLKANQKILLQILIGIIFLFFVGNNSGPLNMASALGIKSYGLICNDPVSELKYSNIVAITPDNYEDNVWNRDRKGMKNLTVEKAYNFIIDNLKITN